jgi:hypothetical protein
MALTPIDEIHALQIQAGTVGRKAGHDFEDTITHSINQQSYPVNLESIMDAHIATGDPGLILLEYIASYLGENIISSAIAISTGALATLEEGKKWLEVNGANVKRCKSDIVLTIEFPGKPPRTFGVSTKQCNNKTPTNAQLYFTTAKGFVKLLRDNSIAVSDAALSGLKQFCGDLGFRPADHPELLTTRVTDPRRFFWEEIEVLAREEWEKTFSAYQDKITLLLLQKAYIDDPFIPEFLIHKTRKSASWHQTEVAIYHLEELVSLSKRYRGYETKPYSVRKGSYKDPVGYVHLAPRFGVVQMQRGGQAQHPEQLQFNLEAGYFYKLENLSGDVNSDSMGE